MNAKQLNKKIKCFPVFIDILGFEEKAKKDTIKTGRDEVDFRRSYINAIERRLDKLSNNGVIISYNKKSDTDYSDEWLVFSSSIRDVFKTISEILKSKLSLALTIGFIEVNDSYLVEISNETVSYLKKNIIKNYKEFYKSKHNGASPKKTFILLTEEAYEKLNSKKICSKPDPSGNFYIIKQENFDKEFTKIEFLEKIGSQRKEYKEIDNLFVEPTNYDKIKNTLETHNIVFIVGDAEMGKTYIAIKLLWEYSNEYEPIYIPEEKWLKQLEIIRHSNELDGKAIYIEDLWGKIQFKGKEAENLYKEFDQFISEVKRNRCKIIITSRKKVFDEFEKRKETVEDLFKYVNQLKIGQSYTKENLTEILKKYIKVFEPKWGKNKILKKIAYEAIEKELKTPMSIKKLIDASKYVEDINDLRNEIEKAAKETKITFSNEIKEIFNRQDFDKIVFLSIPYIIVEPEIAKLCYQEVLKDLGHSINAKNFDDLIEEFNEVELSEVGYLFQNKVTYSLSFVHPSYRDAFKYALTDNGKPNNISENIFSKVLLKLNEINENTESVGWCLISNFKDISDVVRNKLLPSIAKNDSFDIALAYLIYSCYSESRPDMIYEDIRYNLMLKLAENDESAETIAWILYDHFSKISEDVRNNLLLKLSEKITASDFVASIVAENFNKLPKDVRNILFKLSLNDETAEDLAETVSVYFDELPDDERNGLLLKLSETVASEWVAQLVAENFDKLPDMVRNLLGKLQNELESVMEDYDSLEKVNLISKVRTKINRDFALKKLDELSKDKNEEVRENAENLKKFFT